MIKISELGASEKFTICPNIVVMEGGPKKSYVQIYQVDQTIINAQSRCL